MIFCFINCQTREIVNKKESSEYKNALGKLKKLKLKEEKIYNLIGHDYAKINDMLYYMIGDSFYSLSDHLLAIKDEIEDEMIKNRVIYKLTLLINSKENLLESLQEDVMESLELESDPNEEEIDLELENGSLEMDDSIISEREIFLQNNLPFSVIKDLVNAILKILDEYLESEEMALIKTSLIRFKNNMGYAFPNVEEDYINNNFNIDSELYLEARLFTDFLNGDEDDYNTIKDKIVGDALFSLIEPIAFLGREEVDEQIYSEAIVFQVMLRAILLFTSEYLFEHFYPLLHREMKRIAPQSEVGKIIEESFSYAREDKKLPVRVRFHSK